MVNKMDSFTLIIIFVLAGFMEVILGMPLLLEKIKPNWFYGFRTPKTMSNKEIWYKSNKYLGRDFIIIGIILIIGSLFLLLPGISFSLAEIAYIELFLTLIPIIIVLIRGFVYLKKL